MRTRARLTALTSGVGLPSCLVLGPRQTRRPPGLCGPGSDTAHQPFCFLSEVSCRKLPFPWEIHLIAKTEAHAPVSSAPRSFPLATEVVAARRRGHKQLPFPAVWSSWHWRVGVGLSQQLRRRRAFGRPAAVLSGRHGWMPGPVVVKLEPAFLHIWAQTRDQGSGTTRSLMALARHPILPTHCCQRAEPRLGSGPGLALPAVRRPCSCQQPRSTHHREA